MVCPKGQPDCDGSHKGTHEVGKSWIGLYLYGWECSSVIEQLPYMYKVLTQTHLKSVFKKWV